MSSLANISIRFRADLKQFSSQMQNVERRMKQVGKRLSSIGSSMSMNFTAPVVAGLALVTKGTEELRSDLGRLETNALLAGEGLSFIRDQLKEVQAITGETDSSVEALSNLLAAGFKGENLTRALDNISGAAVKFSDTLKFEGIADGLQETLATGKAIGPFSELLERSGINLDDFNKGLAEATKLGEEQNFILNKLASTGLEEVNKKYRENNKDVTEARKSQLAFQMAIADLAKTLQPIVTRIMEFVSRLVTAFNELDPTIKNNALVVIGLVAALGPLLTALGFLMTTVIPGLITAFGILKVAMLATPFGLIAAGIGIAISAFYLFNHETEKVVKSQDQLTQVSNRATEAIAKEKAKVEELLFLARDENVSKQQRIKAIQQLNRISPTYLGNLKLETINTDAATIAVNKYNEALLKTAKAKAAQEKLQEIQAKIIEKELELSARRKAVTDAQALSFSNVADNAQAAAAQKAQLALAEKLLAIETANGTKELEAQAAELLKIINLNNTLLTNSIVPPGQGESQSPRTEQVSVGNVQSQGSIFTAGLIGQDALLQVSEFNEQLLMLRDTAALVGMAVGDAFMTMSTRMVAGLDLADTGLQGFVKNMAATLLEIISMLLSNAIANAIVIGTQSAKATGPAAVFAMPAFIATAVGGVLGAFAAIPKFAEGGIVSGPTMGLMGEYAGAKNNPEVITPLNKLKSMLGDSIGGDMSQIEVIGKISGQDLILINARAQKYRNRRG
jgi:DNA-binding protein YbaB